MVAQVEEGVVEVISSSIQNVTRQVIWNIDRPLLVSMLDILSARRPQPSLVLGARPAHFGSQDRLINIDGARSPRYGSSLAC